VAGDSATRALAASAGLPVFASVAEYETSFAGTDEVPAPPAPPDHGPADAAGDRPKPSRRRAASAKPESETAGPPLAATAASESPTGPTPATPPDEVVPVRVSGPPAFPAAREPGPDPDVGDAFAWRGPDRPPGSRPRHRAEPRPGTRGGSRLPIVIVLAALGLVALVGGVAAYVLLPSATVVVSPRVEALAPLDIVVTADPEATAPDAAALVVPAEVVNLDVTASDTFEATGKRVEEAQAKGTIRFSNLDFLRTNTIPGGSIVSTNAGVRFRTNATITVPRADLVGLTVFPGRKVVGVTAVEPGTAGNVEPNTIVIVPQGEDPQALRVVNPEALSGGTHEEFPTVAQEDVDAALDQLTTALAVAFQARLADPSIADPGATVFDATAILGDATPTVDPSTLVGQEVASFELGLAAPGTVVAVNPAPVAEIADQLLRARVTAGHQLVADSIHVRVGDPVVSGQSVSFSATAIGQEIAVLDPAELRTMILGKPLEAARELLAPYGEVELTAWPEWVASIPTIADRVDVRIEQDIPVETLAPSEPAP